MAICCLVVLAGVAGSPKSTAAASPGLERARPVCATLLDGSCKVKPRELALGARSVMRSIKWKSWGDKKAVGFGRFLYVGGYGDPGGDIGPVKARAKFTQIKTCHGRQRYQRLTVRYGRGFHKSVRRGVYNSCEIIDRPFRTRQ